MTDPVFQSAMAALTKGRADHALALLDRATGETPERQALRVYILTRLGQFREAFALAGIAANAAGLSFEALDLLAQALTLAKQPERAEPLFRRALAMHPDNATALINLAATLRFLGRADEAESLCERALALAPHRFDAVMLRADLRRQTPARNHIDELCRGLKVPGLPWRGEAMIAYALGKEYEDLGRYEEAFEAFAHGAKLRRAYMRYDIALDIEIIDSLIATFNAQGLGAGGAGISDPAPIFVIGLPRSGSTLLERMLSRHPDIESLDEPQTFGAEVIRLVHGQAQPSSRRDFVVRSARIERSSLGGAYLQALAPLRVPRRRFIDKLPLNFLYAGLIATALPEAAIIHIRREPLDVCFSMFKTYFEEAYPFSYDLREIGRYHRAYQRLMAHWNTVLGGRLLHVEYEDLVRDSEPVLRAILERAGLPWNKSCLVPERNPLPSMTASASQIREPVHDRAVGAWRHYEHHLAPLKAMLYNT